MEGGQSMSFWHPHLSTPMFQQLMRSVVMVDVLDEKVPGGKRHNTLQQGGSIISFVDFWTHWDEVVVREVIEAALEGGGPGYDVCTKSSLIQGLIIDEVIGKRQAQIGSLRRGLGKFGILSLCQKEPEMCKPLFVQVEKELTYKDFENMMIKPVTEEHEEVFRWFLTYLKARENEKSGLRMQSVKCFLQCLTYIHI